FGVPLNLSKQRAIRSPRRQIGGFEERKSEGDNS
ncbi:MAG: hypothetical protein ACI82F_002586, partial [Planctomycetota bacterium]